MSDVKVVFGEPPAALLPQQAAVETPSQAIIKDANRVVFVTDERGRKLGVKRAKSGIASFKVTKLLGPDAGNTGLVSQALIYCSVVSIDGDPVPFPTSMAQLEGLIQRLDEEGLTAAFKAQVDEFGVGRDSEVADEAKKQ